jgi:CDP-glucose 4,6-dehydratase
MPEPPQQSRPYKENSADWETLGSTYRGLPVLVTGHTGFKGSWLCWWLLRLGARVSGLSLGAPSPSAFEALELGARLDHHLADVRDARAVHEVIQKTQPQLVFHLAAQALVRRSYRDASLTWETNLNGTLHLLESLRAAPSVRACVVVTTDKCYENQERTAPYRESDALGGHDPYSASKAAVEVLVASYRRSFYSQPASCRLATARAGNVVGGGDWGENRLVPDAVASLIAGRSLSLRNPGATRPWQHVLDCSAGYLRLGQRLLSADGADFAEAWNFGPPAGTETSVGELVERLGHHWGGPRLPVQRQASPLHEAGLLALDSTKARTRLGWERTWDLDQTLQATAEWYRAHHLGEDVRALTDQQLERFVAASQSAGRGWVVGLG